MNMDRIIEKPFQLTTTPNEAPYNHISTHSLSIIMKLFWLLSFTSLQLLQAFIPEISILQYRRHHFQPTPLSKSNAKQKNKDDYDNDDDDDDDDDEIPEVDVKNFVPPKTSTSFGLNRG